MNRLMDKGVLFLLCAVLYMHHVQDAYAVAWILAAIITSAFLSLFEKEYLRILLFAGYLLCCLFAPGAVYFLPFICYDVFSFRKQGLLLFALLPLGNAWPQEGIGAVAWVLFLGMVSFFIYRRTAAFESTAANAISMRDQIKETELHLEQINHELLEKQEYEIRLATLTERNRISRDIHDTVGHLLSSAILQIGALMAVTKDAALQQSLQTLKSTLSHGMDNIRADLHHLHDQSLDLQMEAKRLVDAFSYCSVELEYDVENTPPNNVQYVLLFVLKEALTNIIKHSDATVVHILLREHPGFFQLIVQDNGHALVNVQHTGLGLQNITERVENLNGRVRFNGGNGFTVFVTIPKGAGE